MGICVFLASVGSLWGCAAGGVAEHLDDAGLGADGSLPWNRPDAGASLDAGVDTGAPGADGGRDGGADGGRDGGRDGGGDGGTRTAPDAGPDDEDHTAELPAGVRPPTLWFWRGMKPSNAGWYTDRNGRRCAASDTTMWFRAPQKTCTGGAPSCDPDHFGPAEDGCIGTGPDCHFRNWDDPRGPELRVLSSTGPVEVGNRGVRDQNGNPVDYGFTVWACAAPGTTAVIDTCPRRNVHGCVEDNYPELYYDCRAVPLPVEPAPSLPPDRAGCYSRVNDQMTFQF
jgi:hypothetical protein